MSLPQGGPNDEKTKRSMWLGGILARKRPPMIYRMARPILNVMNQLHTATLISTVSLELTLTRHGSVLPFRGPSEWIALRVRGEKVGMGRTGSGLGLQAHTQDLGQLDTRRQSPESGSAKEAPSRSQFFCANPHQQTCPRCEGGFGG